MTEPDGKGPLGNLTRGRMILGEIRRSGMDWIHLAQDRDPWRALVNTVMNIRGP
jgi:hypothetical protein